VPPPLIALARPPSSDNPGPHCMVMRRAATSSLEYAPLLRVKDGHGRGPSLRRRPRDGALDVEMRGRVRAACAPGRGEDGDPSLGGGHGRAGRARGRGGRGAGGTSCHRHRGRPRHDDRRVGAWTPQSSPRAPGPPPGLADPHPDVPAPRATGNGVDRTVPLCPQLCRSPIEAVQSAVHSGTKTQPDSVSIDRCADRWSQVHMPLPPTLQHEQATLPAGAFRPSFLQASLHSPSQPVH
jgi:hypothetical protein